MKANSLYIYSRYIIQKAISGLGFSIAVFLFYPESVLSSLFIVLLIQEFYFSFYLTILRNNVDKLSVKVDYKPLFILSFIIITILFLFYDIIYITEYLLLLIISLLTFPIYAIKLICNEQYNVEEAVNRDSLSAVSSSLVFFTVLGVLSVNDISTNIIAPLLFMRHLFTHIFYIFSSKKINLNLPEIINPMKDMSYKFYFYGLDLVFLLFSFKFLFFLLYSSSESPEEAGLGIKIFLLFYDFLAAVTGLYIRRLFSDKRVARKSKESIILKISSLYLLCSVILYFALGSANPLSITFLFASLAVLFPIIILCKVFVWSVSRTAITASIFVLFEFGSSTSLFFLPILIMFFLSYRAKDISG